jgi:tight adherence protein B
MWTELLVGLALVGAAACWIALAAREWRAVREWLAHRLMRVLAIDQTRVTLAQAELGWVAPGAWIGARWAVALLAGLLGYGLFGLVVIAAVSSLAAYHLLGFALESQRRRAEARRQRALLDAIRFGVSVMSRAGGAMHMLEALRDSGPIDAQPIFRDLLADAASDESNLLVGAVQRMRQRIADPLFDDIALALTLHWRRGGKLVPALQAIADDWTATLRLQREAKALRAGVEASVLLLTVLPFVFMLLMHLTAPALLAPLSQPVGEVVFSIAVVWMVIGFRILQRMAEPPREERIAFNEAAL